eukprot:1141325-Lingulodinium_polyedra.AAC.1
MFARAITQRPARKHRRGGRGPAPTRGTHGTRRQENADMMPPKRRWHRAAGRPPLPGQMGWARRGR